MSELLARLEALSQSVEKQQREIQLLRQEIRRMANHPVEDISLEKSLQTSLANPVPIIAGTHTGPVFTVPAAEPAFRTRPVKAPKRNLEEYVGGNLINKIGIFILVLGVGIFLKYAIENNLIGPAMQVILGAAAGLLLIGLAYWLKKSYQAYSAVLLSGGVATLYFSTYVAYDFYSLLPHAVAFALMLGVTLFTVYAAMQFDQQVIGVIGQVGAYAVPLLLSQGSGKVAVLFTYIAIINGGIVWVAFRKNWPLMNGAAFVLTWLTYGLWFGLGFEPEKHLWIALGFGFLYFLLFYAVLAFYQLPHAVLQNRNAIFLLLNAFLFFLFGYLAINNDPYENWRGLFTIGLALLNGIIAGLFRVRRWPEPIYYVSLALAITFLTIAVPVQFSNTPVTFLWATEAAVLYWISIRSRARLFTAFAAGLVILSSLSVVNEWQVYGASLLQPHTFLLNTYFLAAVWTVVTQVVIRWLVWKNPEVNGKSMQNFFTMALPVISGLLLYGAFFLEISHYFNYRIGEDATSRIDLHLALRINLQNLKQLWLISFSALYTAGLAWLVIRLNPGKTWNQAVLVFILLVLVWWLMNSLSAAAGLRESYYAARNPHATSVFLWLRYVTYACITISLWMSTRLILHVELAKDSPLPRIFTISIHLFVLAVFSAELLQLSLWLGHGEMESRKQWAQKVGFSVLWGVYALGLVARGFGQKQKLLRLMGIVLFGITLVKLFLFDLSNIPTLGKIVAFVGLGVLLLIISFLYQKYKDVLLAEDKATQ